MRRRGSSEQVSKSYFLGVESDGDGDAAERLVEGDAPGGPVGVFVGKWVEN
ncbi:hypothetical protein PVK06_048359 [Gossypium arboreum]|uniref:Uncharacterized protein n=1 Tax=Gossypium arboreum TaxID=29729 RepID=A0ABR0MFV6_GOSAR|nr:hypothetical protein PVK06_048359 [Gossypium arboreum]